MRLWGRSGSLVPCVGPGRVLCVWAGPWVLLVPLVRSGASGPPLVRRVCFPGEVCGLLFLYAGLETPAEFLCKVGPQGFFHEGRFDEQMSQPL